MRERTKPGQAVKGQLTIVALRLRPGLRVVAIFLATTLILIFPHIVDVPYFIHILVLTGMYLALSLSYDLTVGHVGALSLAHPAFFGVGAYTGALLALRLGAPALPTFAAGALMGVIFAILIGIPSFSLGGHSFAIGTLGFALTIELIARNWIALTRGPMGIPGIPKPVFSVAGLFLWRASTLVDFYYLMAVVVGLVILVYWAIVTSRVGRAFRAVREDEILAAANGINPRAYKMLAFMIGAAMAGALGVFYAYWFGLVSPEVMGFYHTIILLIIVFLGGRGSLRGIALAAFFVTATPEFLRITPELRLVLYGLLLLITIIYFPDGMEGLFARGRAKQ
jgi:ABC-type branched-subunit amino acid transport system permease subunit